MKLQELAVSSPSQNINRVFESYFGSNISLEKLDSKKASYLLRRVKSLIAEHRSTTARHYSEQDPGYLKLVMLEQALSARVQEEVIPVKPATQQPAAQQKSGVEVKDPKLAAALKKSQSGQSLTPDEQKLVAAAALVKQESRLRRGLRTLKESEVQQAQVILAAQDMVDNIQSMLEDTTEMQFKELPALVDSIRNQIGMDQAVQFQSDATAALTGLVQNLQGAKQQLESALGVVTGQAQATPALDAAMAGGEVPAADQAPVPGEEELDLSLDANLPDDEEESEPAGSRSALGRERR
jgi:hypothetical protein